MVQPLNGPIGGEQTCGVSEQLSGSASFSHLFQVPDKSFYDRRPISPNMSRNGRLSDSGLSRGAEAGESQRMSGRQARCTRLSSKMSGAGESCGNKMLVPGKPQFCPNSVTPSLGTPAKPPGLSGPQLSHPQNRVKGKQAAASQPPSHNKGSLETIVRHKETVAQRGEVTCSRPHSPEVQRPRCVPGLVTPEHTNSQVASQLEEHGIDL